MTKSKKEPRHIYSQAYHSMLRPKTNISAKEWHGWWRWVKGHSITLFIRGVRFPVKNNQLRLFDVFQMESLLKIPL